jgi:hypothetical protein
MKLLNKHNPIYQIYISFSSKFLQEYLQLIKHPQIYHKTKMERKVNSTKQSPGGNSFVNLGWQEKSQAPQPVPESSSSDFQSRLSQILKNEEKRKILTKKEVKTSVKVNKPPGGSNNFFFG